MGQAAHVGDRPQPLTVELVENFLVHQKSPASQTVFHVGDIVDQGLVVSHERQGPADITSDQGAAHENFGGLIRGDAAVGNRPVSDNHEPVEADLLVGHHLAAFARPAGGQIGVAALSCGQGLDPGAVDVGGHAREQSGSLHHLRGHDPVASAVEEARSREKHALAAPGRTVDILLFALGDIGQKTAQDRLVNCGVEGAEGLVATIGGGGRRRLVPGRCQTGFSGDRRQLAVNVAPFAHPPEG